MTSVPPTQPPAAPETDVKLTEAERIALDAAVGALGSEDYPGVLFDEAERIIAERLRVVEGERDEALASIEGWADDAQGWKSDALAMKARAESAEAAHEALRKGIEALDRSGRMRFDHSDLRALLAGGEER